MQLEISKIRLDGGTQPRIALNIEVIEDYKERMEANEPFPPITVFFDGTDYWLVDGFHRINAAKRTGLSEFEADVHQGSLEDAQWYSYGVNKTHGLRRSNHDKARTIQAALAHPRSKNFSNYQIAEHCGVNESTVRRYRNALMSKDSDLSTAKPQMRTVNRGGKTYKQNTARIGKGRHKKTKPRNAAEYYEAKQQGQKVRLPCMIKLELPNNNVSNCAYDLLRYFTFEYLQKVFTEIINIHQQENKEKLS